MITDFKNVVAADIIVISEGFEAGAIRVFADLAEIINLDGQLVINTGCCLGKENFAQVFLNKGVGSYIGSSDYIEAAAIITFITTFIYFHMTMQMPIDKAFNKASNIDFETQMMQLARLGKPL